MTIIFIELINYYKKILFDKKMKILFDQKKKILNRVFHESELRVIFHP